MRSAGIGMCWQSAAVIHQFDLRAMAAESRAFFSAADLTEPDE
jgi:hypothetical protein